MAFRRLPSVPFTPDANPFTQGLVFFGVLDSAYKLVNLILPGGGTASQPSGQEIVAGIAGYPGLNFNSGNSEYIDWDRQAIGNLTGGGVSVIARVNPTLASGAVGSIFGTYQASPQDGFMLYFNDAGGADEGLAFIVGEAGSILFSNSGTKANYSGYEYTCGGRYDSFARKTSVWQNGIKLDEDADLGTAWLTTATSYLHTARLPTTSNFYDGNIYWIAVFNRELTDPEMVVWQTVDPMELLLPPQMPLIIPSAITMYLANEVLVYSVMAGQSPFELGLDLTAGAVLAGDLASVPPVPPVFALQNEVLVNGANGFIVAPGNLLVLQNVVTVTDAVSMFSPFALSNEVAVGSSLQTQVGNVLVGDRYRR